MMDLLNDVVSNLSKNLAEQKNEVFKSALAKHGFTFSGDADLIEFVKKRVYCASSSNFLNNIFYDCFFYESDNGKLCPLFKQTTAFSSYLGVVYHFEIE